MSGKATIAAVLGEVVAPSLPSRASGGGGAAAACVGDGGKAAMRVGELGSAARAGLSPLPLAGEG
jgi:hypothetical protein